MRRRQRDDDCESVARHHTFLLGMPTSAAERESEETMPRVTVESRPTALPIAMTQSPTCRRG